MKTKKAHPFSLRVQRRSEIARNSPEALPWPPWISRFIRRGTHIHPRWLCPSPGDFRFTSFCAHRSLKWFSLYQRTSRFEPEPFARDRSAALSVVRSLKPNTSARAQQRTGTQCESRTQHGPHHHIRRIMECEIHPGKTDQTGQRQPNRRRPWCMEHKHGGDGKRGRRMPGRKGIVRQGIGKRIQLTQSQMRADAGKIMFAGPYGQVAARQSSESLHRPLLHRRGSEQPPNNQKRDRAKSTTQMSQPAHQPVHHPRLPLAVDITHQPNIHPLNPMDQTLHLSPNPRQACSYSA